MNTALTWYNVLAVGVGGAIGCWSRWLLAVGLNALEPRLPIGTLTANLVGGLCIGVALGYIANHPEWPVAWRLFVITGFLGGLTTFSTFSGEAFLLLQRSEFGWALAHIASNLFGSIALCTIGYTLVHRAAP